MRFLLLSILLNITILCVPVYSGQITLCDMGSNGGLHPDVIFFPNGKTDGATTYKFWAVHTPLPECEEYVTVCVSNDGSTWSTPSGTTNPVFQQNAGTSGPECEFDADPDWLYVDTYSKWFMVTGPEVTISTRENAIEFFYSSDGESWTAYDGTQINGNTLPVILSGSNGSCGQHTADSARAAWEATGNCGNTQYPTLYFDKDNNLGVGENTFWLWYGETVSAANNRGQFGCATFTWNNTTNDIENFARCNSETHGKDNPVIDDSTDLPAVTGFDAGAGHIDIAWNGQWDRLEALIVRGETAGGNNFTLWRGFSTDGVTWTNWHNFMDVGTSETHSCPSTNGMYRSSWIHDGEGNVVNDSTLDYFPIMYSMTCGSGGHDFGIKNLGDFNVNDMELYLDKSTLNGGPFYGTF